VAGDLPLLRAPTPERREQVIAQLSDHFAAGRLEVDQLEQRIELALRVATVAELDALLADVAAPASAGAPLPAEAKPGPERRGGKRVSVAVFSGFERKGAWRPARRHYGLALMGGFGLDFREAELGPGATDVYLFTLWGGVAVTVPPDLDVETSGFALMGGVKEVNRHPAGGTERPVLRIHATAVMGGVEVKVKARTRRAAAIEAGAPSPPEGDDQS